MKMKFNKLVMGCLLFSLAVNLSFAKNINLYNDPVKDTKVVGTIDTSKGMVPIFTTKDNQWMKVGNPQNGDVGWIKTSDLESKTGTFSTGMSITERTINTSTGPKSYKMIQFGVPSTEESQTMLKQMEQNQREMQQSMQKVFKDMSEINRRFFQSTNFETSMPATILVPVVVTPDMTQEIKKDTTKSSTTVPPKTLPSKS